MFLQLQGWAIHWVKFYAQDELIDPLGVANKHESITQQQQFQQLVQFRPAMSNPTGLMGQNVCHYLNQGRTLNDILLRAAHWMAYFDLSKLNLS